MNTWEQMSRIGNEILTGYKGDLWINRKSLNLMKNGEESFWEIHSGGTNLLHCGYGYVSLEFQESAIRDYTGKSSRWFHFKKNQLWEEITAPTVEERKEKIVRGIDQMNKKLLDQFFDGVVNAETIRKIVLDDKKDGVLVVDPMGNGSLHLTQESRDLLQKEILNAKAAYYFRKGNYFATLNGEEDIIKEFEELPLKQYRR